MKNRRMSSHSDGPSVTVKIQVGPVGGKPARSVQTGNLPYESIKHLVSDKPLRRPNRTHYIHRIKKTG